MQNGLEKWVRLSPNDTVVDTGPRHLAVWQEEHAKRNIDNSALAFPLKASVRWEDDPSCNRVIVGQNHKKPHARRTWLERIHLFMITAVRNLGKRHDLHYNEQQS